ncbi:MAG: DUF58 domain-containing protein [Pseudomonadales bacterium]|nr:DUF58 domain-containing protein [Pseudomonadales bacterium]
MKHLDKSGSLIQGAYITLPQLVRLKSQPVRPRPFQHPGRSTMAGQNRSKLFGRGLEFEESRIYQPGDDIGTIDWRVTARSQVTHTKVFHEEKDRPVFILLDQSQSMFFGSRYCFKSVKAAETAALLSWDSHNNGDRCGGVIFSDTAVSEFKPTRNRRYLLQWLKQIETANQQLKPAREIPKPVSQKAETNHNVGTALAHTRQLMKTGSTLYLISDFAQFDGTDIQLLQGIAQHNQVEVFLIYDPLEAEIPQQGQYWVTDSSERSMLDGSNRKFRKQYQQQFEQRLEELREQLFKLKISLNELSTEESLQAFSKNARRVAP